ETTKKYPDLFKAVGDGTFRFKKEVKVTDIKAKNDEKLMALWKKSRRYDGKGCMDAVSHIEGVLAKAFLGRKVGKLGSLLDADKELLGLELGEAIRMGRIPQDAPKDKKIHAMQRKSVLGMNAILSMSLALGRAIAAGQGKELWQLIREISADTMSKFVAANAKGEKRSAAELKAMDYDQLQALYRKTAAEAIKEGKTLYELLRAQLPVYPV
ncbi:MAG TPA: hypothetical protein PK373_07985, partial [Sedimentisphaerales bacterium]|nr:hypothetical protein [Sedimentisphaerales bacterium]